MPQPKGPIEYPIDSLSHDHFEALTFLLARTVDSAVVPVRIKDRGLDARLADRRGRTIRGWQAKRHTSGINWGDCEKSIRVASAFWRPPHMTFCFPHDLSAGEQETFREKLVEAFPRVRIDFWPGSEMQRLIRDTDEGQRAAQWLFENPDADRAALERALATGGPLATTTQAVDRQAEIQTFMDRDPHMHYTMVSKHRTAPETPLTETTVISVELDRGETTVRLDASERYPGALKDAGMEGTLMFSDNEDGRRALETVDRILREGGQATIESGMAADFGAVPIGLRGVVPETPMSGQFHIQADDAKKPLPEPLAVVVASSSSELGMSLVPQRAPGEEDKLTFAGAAGGLEVFLSGYLAEGGFKTDLSWRYSPGEGTGFEQLLACEIVTCALQGETIELRSAGDGEILVAGAYEGKPPREDAIADLLARRDFLEYVTEIETWLGAPLDPPADLNEEDAKELGRVLSLIREPSASVEWREVKVVPTVKPPGDGPWAFALVIPEYSRLFGTDVFLGTQLLHLPKGRIEKDGEDHILILPWNTDLGHGNAQLFPPDQAPPQLGVAPSG